MSELFAASKHRIFRLFRFFILFLTVYTIFLYTQSPATSHLRSCKYIFPSLEKLDLSSYRTVGLFLAETFNSSGKLFVSSGLGQSVARFFEQKNIQCSSYVTIVLSAVLWLLVFLLSIAISTYLSARATQRTLRIRLTSAALGAGPTQIKGGSLEEGARRLGVRGRPGQLPTPTALRNNMSLEDALLELNSLIGLQHVKDELAAVISLEKLNLRRKAEKLPSLKTSRHLVFSGNPGTGKTTVARLLGRIYAAAGALSSGHLVETDRSGLVHPYIGQTARLTLERVNEARGGILFIDEAYTLFKKDSPNDTGTESIDTLLKSMEDYRDDLCVIVAGYTNQMGDFIQSNPGLQSRFSKIIEFPDYTSEELLTIFKKMLSENHLEMTKEDLSEVFIFIKKDYDLGLTKKGNGRYIRNLVEASIERQAIRLDITKENDLSRLLFEDVKKSFN